MEKSIGPRGWPLLGVLPHLLGDRLSYMLSLQKQYGDVVTLPVGPLKSYVLYHPDDIQQVLFKRHSKYFKGRSFEKTKDYLGNGLATSEGDFWASQRRRMGGHFNWSTLSQLTDLMLIEIDKFIDSLIERSKKGESVDISTEFQRLALKTIVRTLFGSAIPTGDVEKLVESFRYVLKHTLNRIVLPFDIPNSFPLPSNLKFNRELGVMDSVVAKLIKEESERKTPSQTLMGILVRATDPEGKDQSLMSQKQLRDEIMTLFLGGTDTSGNTMGWTTYNLARFPAVMAKAREEVDNLIGQRPPTFQDFEKMSFVKSVISETLRLFPQNWIMSRDTLEEDEIRGVKIPKGKTVFMAVYSVHRDPRFWDDPLKFDPGRFQTGENLKHPVCYLPFGGGPRKCIGFHFAYLEMTLAIARLLQRTQLQFTNLESVRPDPQWSLMMKPGLRVMVSPR